MIKYSVGLILNMNDYNTNKRYTPEKCTIGRKIMFGERTYKIDIIKHKLLTETGLLEEILR